MNLAINMDDHSGKSRPFSARMDIVRSYPSLGNRRVSAEATIHDVADTGFFGTAMLRLARGMHVRIRLPGAGARDAEVTWAEFPNFACTFRQAGSADEVQGAKADGAEPTSSRPMLRGALGLGSLLFLLALLVSLWS